jgi:hypothetical protein
MRKSVLVEIKDLTTVHTTNNLRVLQNTPNRKYVVEPNMSDDDISPFRRMLFDTAEEAYSFVDGYEIAFKKQTRF